MSTDGVENIRYVYTVWQVLNRQEPTITNIVFDGNTAVVHLIQNISPCIFPAFVKLQVPSVTELHFKKSETDTGTLKVYKQEDSWTLEGLIQSMPLISFWYNHVLRVVMGKLVTTTGDLLGAAFQQVQKMTIHGHDIQHLSHQFAMENKEKLDTHRSNLQEYYLRGVHEWNEAYICIGREDPLEMQAIPQSYGNLVETLDALTE
ncbi:hypothetical protein BCR42DRAFT_457955 [Absidia repens]|uniref:Uncharacterized protein n=1 Tax=Absidia repens TaxID=90262 RepID=A0A1X2J1R9_9FUNG|nr:hypothetical protein BCR42DRAFT_457955 [Absidia repens]